MSQRLRQYGTRANMRNAASSDSEIANNAEIEPLTKKQKAAKTREANRVAARRKEEEILAQTKGECDAVPLLLHLSY